MIIDRCLFRAYKNGNAVGVLDFSLSDFEKCRSMIDLYFENSDEIDLKYYFGGINPDELKEFFSNEYCYE